MYIPHRRSTMRPRYDLRVQSVGLPEAWGLWWQGKSVQGMLLWGIPMLIVGRAGKIISFIGAIVAVVDIVGPARIRQWASRTQRNETTVYRAYDVIRRIFFRKLFGIRRYTYTVFHAVFHTLTFGGLIVALILYGKYVHSSADTVSTTFLQGAMAGLVLIIAILVLGALIFLGPAFIEKVVKGIARVLENDRWERVVRWSGFAAVIIGFSFDLLAS